MYFFLQIVVAIIALVLSGGNFFLFLIFGFIGYVIVQGCSSPKVRKEDEWEYEL